MKLGNALRKKTVAFLLTAALMLTSASAYACTGVYVGKGVSETGSTIIARSVDTHPTTTITRELVVDRVENQPGRKLEGLYGFSWALPDTTYKYTATPFATGVGAGRYASACMNEFGLAVTGTVTGYVCAAAEKADPGVEGGLCEEVVAELVAATCQTAKEGVELIGKVMSERGSSEQNIIMIADQTEAWYVETYTGHQWAAMKMPEDAVAAYGNEFMIQHIDPESEDVLYSEGLFTMPEENGFAVYSDDGRLDIFATYAGGLANYANRRTWMGHMLLAPSTAGEYAQSSKYDLFYAPDKKVSLEQVMELFRNRFEGTQFSPDETGTLDKRVIGTETQASVHILEVYDNLPAEMACVGWQCLNNAEHSVFLPVSNLVTDTADAYKKDTEDGAGLSYDLSLASVNFKRLCALSEQDRTYYGAGVRDYWHGVEQNLIATYPEELAKVAAMYAESPVDAAKYITDYTVSLQETALDEARQMFDELMWFVMENTDTLRYRFSYRTLQMDDTFTRNAFVPSFAQYGDPE